MRSPGIFLALSAAACLALPVASQAACTPAKTAPSAAQVARGATVYVQNCAACHGEKLEGLLDNALVDAKFKAKWSEQSVGELFNFIESLMPIGKPATLSKAQYLDVMAFILAANGRAKGKVELVDGSPAFDECATSN